MIFNNRHLVTSTVFYLTSVVAGVVRIRIIFIIVPQIRTGERVVYGSVAVATFVVILLSQSVEHFFLSAI